MPLSAELGRTSLPVRLNFRTILSDSHRVDETPKAP